MERASFLCEKYMNNKSSKTDMKFISLRYFNVAGASIDGQIGEFHSPELI